MKTTCKFFFILLVLLNSALGEDHVIYTIDQSIPMGDENELIKKNYYVNIGSNQGVKEGSKLSVFRTISKINPYNNQKLINYRIKIGELVVVHSDTGAAIGKAESFNDDGNTPYTELSDFMIGDQIEVSL